MQSWSTVPIMIRPLFSLKGVGAIAAETTRAAKTMYSIYSFRPNELRNFRRMSRCIFYGSHACSKSVDAADLEAECF